MSRFRKWYLLVVALLTGCWVLYFHRVSLHLTEEDKHFITQYLEQLPAEYNAQVTQSFAQMPYINQLDLVQSIQRIVLVHNPPSSGIPEGQLRNPKQLYESGLGQCYDRSYLMEKIFRYLEAEVRHLSLYQTDEHTNTAWQLLTHNLRSHAALEIKTQQGWMIVDPNTEWVGIDQERAPVDCRKIQEQEVHWLNPPSKELAPFYQDSATAVYGLYSRHGQFFPPYNPIPDIHWPTFFVNL